MCTLPKQYSNQVPQSREKKPTPKLATAFTFVSVLLIHSPTSLAASDKLPIPADLPAEYHECHKVLWAPPLTTLKDFVPKGYGARLSTGGLEDQVKGLRCSDAQIIEYMEQHGLPYHSKFERADVVTTGRGPYNRILDFCIKSRGLLTRLWFGDCGGVTRFNLLDDQITHIISHGFK